MCTQMVKQHRYTRNLRRFVGMDIFFIFCAKWHLLLRLAREFWPALALVLHDNKNTVLSVLAHVEVAINTNAPFFCLFVFHNFSITPSPKSVIILAMKRLNSNESSWCKACYCFPAGWLINTKLTQQRIIIIIIIIKRSKMFSSSHWAIPLQRDNFPQQSQNEQKQKQKIGTADDAFLGPGRKHHSKWFKQPDENNENKWPSLMGSSCYFWLTGELHSLSRRVTGDD